MIQFISFIITFFIINWLVWLITEKYDIVPACLRYKPFICRICATFWTLVTIGAFCMVQHWWISGWGLMVMAVLNSIAMKYHQFQNTEEL